MTPEQIKALENLRTLLNKREIVAKRIAKEQATMDKIDAELLPYLGKLPG